MKRLSHVDTKGKAKMVDVSEKKASLRTAEAYARVDLSGKVFKKVRKNEVGKGDVLSAARTAGIMGAKRTSELIPLCHNILISSVDIDFNFKKKGHAIEIISRVKTNSVTGVEMEALTAVSVAALTVYDMCKALDRSIKISDIHLVSKTGGKSGAFRKR